MSLRRDRVVLFGEHVIHEVLSAQGRALRNEIETYDADQLLGTSEDKLIDYFVQKYQIEAPRLDEGAITVDQAESRLDVSRDPYRVIFDRSRPFHVTATTVRFYVPYEGDQQMFKVQPTSHKINPSVIEAIDDKQLTIAYTHESHDADALKSTFEGELSEIRAQLAQLENDSSDFNKQLGTTVRQMLSARREKIIKDRGTVAGLGYPIRRRADAPQTYIAPVARRRPEVSRPPAAKGGALEPSLDIAEYEHILRVISNMVSVMERSPKAFQTMAEEDLRQHFLVQLNAQYEGQATGETFNFEGKTDILIRAEGRNIFIAECKFWSGPKALQAAVDQLLSYATWRDTKLALLVFYRGKDFTGILRSIGEVMQLHPLMRQQLAYTSETGFRYRVVHRDDREREMTLTVLAFHIPSASP
jgi:hypothetical protein